MTEQHVTIRMDREAYTNWERDILAATSSPPSDAESAGAFLIRGHILRDHNEIEAAIASYAVFLHWEPANESALKSIVSAHEARGDYACAMEYVIKAWHASWKASTSPSTSRRFSREWRRIFFAMYRTQRNCERCFLLALHQNEAEPDHWCDPRAPMNASSESDAVLALPVAAQFRR